MGNLPRCELCGTNTSSTDNERFNIYTERLVNACIMARDEKSLVFLAKDSLDNLFTGTTSSARELSHEKGDDYYGSCWSHNRLSEVDDSIEKINNAIKYLNHALDSLKKESNND